jgi:hypothetical protein
MTSRVGAIRLCLSKHRIIITRMSANKVSATQTAPTSSAVLTSDGIPLETQPLPEAAQTLHARTSSHVAPSSLRDACDSAVRTHVNAAVRCQRTVRGSAANELRLRQGLRV